MAAGFESKGVGTAHSRVYAGLCAALMNGDFLPGQRLVVRELAERFDTSAMPVREALRQLVSDGAFFDHPNRGVIVPEATVEVVADLVRVRCTIEGSATEWAAATVSADELRHLETLNEAMVERTSAGSAADYLALNREFHFTIYRASRSKLMLPIIERLWLRAGPWLNIMREEATLGLGLDHHLDMLAGLRTGDGQAARRALVADISDAADIILRAIAGGYAPKAQKPRRQRGERADTATVTRG